MRATTPKFKQIMASGNARDYVVKVDLTLADDPNNPTVLHLTEEDIWNDSFSIDTASSGTSSFDIGTAVIGQCKFSLNNFDERFNQYDFFNASAVVWVGLVGDIDNNNHQVYYRLGFYTVDEPTYAGALIQLILLDNMWKFDVPMITLNYPISCLNAVLAICSYCGVSLDQTAQFHGANFNINKAPERVDNMNCREFLQYVAMIGCNFCVITPTGELKLRWYDTASIPEDSDLDGGTFNTNTTPYSDGDNANGGNFFDYSSSDEIDGGGFNDNPNVAYFTRNFNLSLGTDLITITGIKFIIDDVSYTIGDEGYRLELNNPLVNADNVNSVLNLIWEVLHPDNNTYFTLRTFNLTTASNLAPEVGDCCAIKDYKGNYIYSWITMNTFAFSNHQVRCDAIQPTRKLTTQYSKTVQAAVEVARKQTNEQISTYDLDVQLMNSLAINASGGYENYEDSPTGGRIWYWSNMPITKNPSTGVCSFEPNSVVYKKSGTAMFVSNDGGTTWNNAYDPQTGKLVINSLSAIGINADWIKAGQVEADRMSANVITAINAPKGSSVCLTFDSRCSTESTVDYIRFWYVENNTTYYSQKYSGETLAGQTFRIPRTTFYVEWHSDSSVTDWGIKVTEGGIGTSGTLVAFSSGGTLPSTAVTSIGSNVTWIETSHPYTDYENKLWLVSFDSSLTISADKININGEVTLTNFVNGMATGSTVISGDCIKTGTLDGITLIAGTSNGSKLVIEDGAIKAYYNDAYAGQIQMIRSGNHNSVDFDFTNSNNYSMYFRCYRNGHISFSMGSDEILEIFDDHVSIDTELRLYSDLDSGGYVKASDGFVSAGSYGTSWSGYLGDRYVNISGGIITSVN